MKETPVVAVLIDLVGSRRLERRDVVQREIETGFASVGSVVPAIEPLHPSKAALVGFARSLTRELGARNITANVVAPGFIETDVTAELPAEQQAEYRKSIPLGRYGTADEVAKVTRWLAGDEAAYISGAVIPVDGGLGMGH